MKQMFLNRAIARAVMEEMKRDESIILLGEDVLSKGGGTGACLGVPEMFPGRCLDMPLEELGYTSFAVGAAMAGKRPIVDLMYSSFCTYASDAIVNTAAKMRFHTLGEIKVPVVFLMANGGKGVYGGYGIGATHSQCAESWFLNVPGLKIVAPYYAADVMGLLKAAIRDDDPVLFFYPAGSIGLRTPVPEEETLIPLQNAANILRKGTDVTVIAIHSMVPVALKAAEKLAEEGVSCEVIDPRVIVPLDKEKLVASAKKTGRVVIVHEAHTRGGIGGEIAAELASACVPGLKAPIKRVGSLNSPIPCGYYEEYMTPHAEDVIAAVHSVMADQ